MLHVWDNGLCPTVHADVGSTEMVLSTCVLQICRQDVQADFSRQACFGIASSRAHTLCMS